MEAGLNLGNPYYLHLLWYLLISQIDYVHFKLVVIHMKLTQITSPPIFIANSRLGIGWKVLTYIYIYNRQSKYINQNLIKI